MSKSIIGALLVAMALTGCACRPATKASEPVQESCVARLTREAPAYLVPAIAHRCNDGGYRYSVDCTADAHCSQVYGGEY